jgi:hypothetical protein
MIVTREAVRVIMMELLKININKWSVDTVNKHFVASFGLDDLVVARTWNELSCTNLLPSGGKVKHLLWMLSYFKTFSSFTKLSREFKVAICTMRTWVWVFAEAVARMSHIVSTVRSTKYTSYCIYNGVFTTTYPTTYYLPVPSLSLIGRME